jgi:hypothetical protein
MAWRVGDFLPAPCELLAMTVLHHDRLVCLGQVLGAGPAGLQNIM